ncbi:MAG: 6,7-dimethyl-8-ribityllumazine synthase [Chloroflexi bacterium]|nr:6,7-dimethyl-8-ribityllumazine synthase [Chloroflexota bacterium]
MGNIYKGHLDGRGLKIGIVVSRFNEAVTSRLLDGALEGLGCHGVAEEDVDVSWTPGSLELSIVAKRLAESGNYSAIICLGAVIRGETSHFDYVSSGTIQGVVNTNLETGIPVIFGVLTTENSEQARERSGGKKGNKGFDAATNAIEMANLLKELPGA